MDGNPQCDHGDVVREAEAAQMLHELLFIHRLVNNNVLGVLSVLTQEYLDELKLFGVIFGGGDLEQWYQVEATCCEEQVCYLDLDHPTVPNWLWMNKVTFTEFRVQVPFTDFQQVFSSVPPWLRHSSTQTCDRPFAISNWWPNFWSCLKTPRKFQQLLEAMGAH
ncbi:hypothetical protein PIB30_014172 [Stylosanthes scabra]|uniref:Uncharacterized protein n=1 Tax=Stylosanthes scabra TaxID=79078 RepID=A0ABU6V5N7_9FABA|nr:hypothetical protein [Stylosanthes scabra]